MTSSDWIALTGTLVALAGVLAAAGVSWANMRFTDRQRQRERQADKEAKDLADRREKEAARTEWRESLLISLMPLLRLLDEHPPLSDASDSSISRHIESLTSEGTDRAVESLVYVGLIYPSPLAQVAAGSVQASIAGALMLEERALQEPDAAARQHLLGAAEKTLRNASGTVRDLAREIRGPLPWELGLDVPSDLRAAGPGTLRAGVAQEVTDE